MKEDDDGCVVVSDGDCWGVYATTDGLCVERVWRKKRKGPVLVFFSFSFFSLKREKGNVANGCLFLFFLFFLLIGAKIYAHERVAVASSFSFVFLVSEGNV